MILFGTASLARECDEMSLKRGAAHLREYLLKYGAKASRNIFDSSVDKKRLASPSSNVILIDRIRGRSHNDPCWQPPAKDKGRWAMLSRLRTVSAT